MAILTTGTIFQTGQQVTAVSLNNAVNNATFASGAVANGGGLSVSSGGASLFVTDGGIVASKLASDSVTTVKITDANVTPAKLSAGAPTWSSSTVTIPSSLDFSAISTATTSGTYTRTGNTITVTMNGHNMTNGMVVNLTILTGSGTSGSYPISNVSTNTFEVTDSSSGTTSGNCNRTAYYGNSNIRGSETVAGNLSVTNNLSVTGSLSIGGSTVRLLTSGTSQATTSGSAIDFTGIPSWVKRITILVNGVSTNGATVPLLQIGSGSIATSGYSANVGTIGITDNATSSFICNLGIPFSGYASTAAATYTGILFLVNISENTWICSGSVFPNNCASSTIAGSISLSGSIDRVRLTTITGTTVGSGTFDAGQINIMYE